MRTHFRLSIVACVLTGCLLAPIAAAAQSDNPNEPKLAVMTLAGDNGRSFDVHFSPSDLVFEVSRPTGSAGAPSATLVLLGALLGANDQSFVEDRAFNDEVWSECPAAYRITTDSPAAKKAFELARVSDLAWVIASTSQRYTLFLPDATPTRATVQLRMKEADKPTTRSCKPRR
jgi:hypothetical protein